VYLIDITRSMNNNLYVPSKHECNQQIEYKYSTKKKDAYDAVLLMKGNGKN